MTSFPFRVSSKLLAIVVGVSTNQVGLAYRLAPANPGDGAAPPTVKVSTVLSATGGASTPTAQIVIETSADGITWIVAASGTVRAADGTTNAEVLDPNGGFLELFVRAKLVLAGGTLPTATCQVEIVGDRPFVLIAAA